MGIYRERQKKIEEDKMKKIKSKGKLSAVEVALHIVQMNCNMIEDIVKSNPKLKLELDRYNFFEICKTNKKVLDDIIDSSQEFSEQFTRFADEMDEKIIGEVIGEEDHDAHA